MVHTPESEEVTWLHFFGVLFFITHHFSGLIDFGGIYVFRFLVLETWNYLRFNQFVAAGLAKKRWPSAKLKCARWLAWWYHPELATPWQTKVVILTTFLLKVVGMLGYIYIYYSPRFSVVWWYWTISGFEFNLSLWLLDRFARATTIRGCQIPMHVSRDYAWTGDSWAGLTIIHAAVLVA